MVKIKIVNRGGQQLPAYATELSAGMDLRANIDESITLNPMERRIIPTGLYIALPPGYEAQVRPRSGRTTIHRTTEETKLQNKMKVSVFPLRHILLWLMSTALLPANAQRLVMPAALRAGDTIAIVSPSSTPDTLTVEKGCQTLREWGYVPVVAPHALNSWHGFAGTADERAADMLWALRDSTVKAIICSRGGDGAVQVLRRIQLSEFRCHPKWVMGFSDDVEQNKDR